MCTLTVVTLTPENTRGRTARRTVRFAFNRDELISRRAALPPLRRNFGERAAILPVDPVSSGTWTAVNDHGIAAALLNVNLVSSITGSPPSRSRGAIIPLALESASLAHAAAVVGALMPREFPPFRLVLASDAELAEVRSNGVLIEQWRGPLGERPRMFTSSGLGDALVEPPRRELFESMFRVADDVDLTQAKFHRHSWPDRRHVSVCMKRTDARTVSHTVIDVDESGAAMTYFPDSPDLAAAEPTLHLPRTSH